MELRDTNVHFDPMTYNTNNNQLIHISENLQETALPESADMMKADFFRQKKNNPMNSTM
jgi:hypothetical protein